MQVGGGALGLLIVDDLPGSLPDEVARLPERHLVISDLRPSSLVHVGARAKQDGKQARMAEADRAFLEKFGKKALPKEPAAEP